MADSLALTHQRARALVPSYPWIASEGPWPVADVSARGRHIAWSAPEPEGAVEDAVRFVVYRFDRPDAIDLNDATAGMWSRRSTAPTTNPPPPTPCAADEEGVGHSTRL